MRLAELVDPEHVKDLERLRNFKLMDDVFFTKFFENDKEAIQLIIRIISGKDDLVVEDVRTQVFMENMFNRSLRLDIVARDSTGRVYNIEIQRDSRGAGHKRARYHCSVMDVNLLNKSSKFDELPEVYVIFITEKDVFGRGKPAYHIERYISDLAEKFEDGSHIIYVNGAYRDDTPVGLLMHDFSCADPDEMHYDILAERMRFFKETKEGVKSMSSMVDELREEGRKEGRREGIITMVLRMLEDGKYALEQIANMSGLSLSEIKELQAGMNQ